MTETLTIEGEIQAVKKNQKGVEIENEWYNSFTLIEDLEKGDIVKLNYVKNKGFNNIKSYEKVIQKPKEIKNQISDSTINTLLMNIKEIHLANQQKLLLEVTKSVIESYKFLRDNI